MGYGGIIKHAVSYENQSINPLSLRERARVRVIMKFVKLHGAGNDYIYVDARYQSYDWPEVARRVSDRHLA